MNQAALQGCNYGLSAVADSHAHKDDAQMTFDSSFTDEQFSGDLAIGTAMDEVEQHLFFTC